MPLPMFAIALAEDRLDRRHLVRATVAAEVFDPSGAVAAGYLDRVVPAAQVEGAAVEEARRLGGYSRTAYSQTKAVMRGALVARVREGAEADLARFAVEPS
jgi:enoyl-CoA hydratase